MFFRDDHLRRFGSHNRAHHLKQREPGNRREFLDVELRFRIMVPATDQARGRIGQ